MAVGDRVELGDVPSPAASRSARLTAYPADLLATPPDQSSLTISAVAGGPPAAPFVAPGMPRRSRRRRRRPHATAGLAAAVPGGVGDELGKLLGARDLTPPIVALSLLLAAGLGALHAVSPGHGKTVMAAYLVGSRGLGPARGRRWASRSRSRTPSASSCWRRSRSSRATSCRRSGSIRSSASPRGSRSWRSAAGCCSRAGARCARSAPIGPAMRTRTRTTTTTTTRLAATATAGGTTRTSRAASSGGATSSRSAWPADSCHRRRRSSCCSARSRLGRPLYGLVLAIAFGVGMAVVLSGIGYLLVVAGGRLERWSLVDRLRPAAAVVPWATAVLVLGSGIFLTSQALHTTF